ncbi:unnamed protein product [Ectocarpus sp. 12 AP-2014]
MATAEAPVSAVAKDAQVQAPEFVEVYDEPLHPTVFENEYVRVLKVDCPMNQDTMYHRHSQDSFFLFFRTAQIRNEVVGKEPFEVELEAGSFYWGDHLANPIIHKICVGNRKLDCMDIEIKVDRPRPASLSPALPRTSQRDLCFENDVLRAYRVKLAPGECISSVFDAEGGDGSMVPVPFGYLAVAMTIAKLSSGEVKPGDRWWCGKSSGDIRAGDAGTTADGAWSNVGEEEVEAARVRKSMHRVTKRLHPAFVRVHITAVRIATLCCGDEGKHHTTRCTGTAGSNTYSVHKGEQRRGREQKQRGEGRS